MGAKPMRDRRRIGKYRAKTATVGTHGKACPEMPEPEDLSVVVNYEKILSNGRTKRVDK